VAALAAPITRDYLDPFGQQSTHCGSPLCDVIGDPSRFDLQSVRIAVDAETRTATATLAFNFGLGPYNLTGVRLEASDLLFGSGDAILWGVPLTSRGALVAGHFYQVSPSGVLTAAEVLNEDMMTYRRDQPVRIRDDGHRSVTEAGSGDLSAAQSGDGLHSAKWIVSLSFEVTDDFISGFTLPSFTTIFSSATCGNDILKHSASAEAVHNPEPSTYLLALTSALAICILRLRARR
jgi:hypothetical protein